MKILRPLWFLLLCGQFSSAQTAFTEPSEAYEYARRPLTEWEHSHTRPQAASYSDNWSRHRTATW